MTDGSAMPAGPVDATRPTMASRLAVLSFASGLVLCCPGTGALALVAGIAALLLGMGEAGASWRKFALGGIGLGAVGLILFMWFYFGVHGWWEREGRILYSGPNNALVALDQGDMAGFRGEFMGPAAELPEEAILAFKAGTLESFGRFRVCRSTRQEPPVREGPGPWTIGEYEAIFFTDDPPSERRVPAKIGLDAMPSGTLRLTWIILDPEGDPIGYPERATKEAPDG